MNKKLLTIAIGSVLTLALLVFFIMAGWKVFVGGDVDIDNGNDVVINDVVIIDDIKDSPFGYLNCPNLEKYYKDLGVKWTRSAAQWGKLQPQNSFQEGVYDWEAVEDNWNLDEFDDTMNRVITISFLGTPVEQTGSYIPSVYPYDKGNYLLYVEELVNRYKDRVKYFQVENEPKKNIKDFAELQKITYTKIKDVCSDCIVLIGGHAAGAETVQGFDGIIFPILQELDGKYMDIFDVHWFGDKYDSNVRDPSRNDEGKLTIDIIRERLEQSNFGGIDIWITESGTYSGKPNQPIYAHQSEKEQASSLIKRYVSPLADGVKKIMWAWGTTESFKRDCRFFDYTGLIYDGCDCEDGKYVCKAGVGYDKGQGVKKLGYYSYKLMVEKLEGSDWENIETIIELENSYVYKFIKNGNPIWVAWSDTGSGSISLSSLGISSAKVTEAVPDADSGAELNENNYPDFFKTYTTSGQITLGENPVFIEGK